MGSEKPIESAEPPPANKGPHCTLLAVTFRINSVLSHVLRRVQDLELRGLTYLHRVRPQLPDVEPDKKNAGHGPKIRLKQLLDANFRGSPSGDNVCKYLEDSFTRFSSRSICQQC